jgi:hypothetical protein
MVHFILIFLAILTTGHAFIEAEPRLVLSSYPVGIDKCDGDHRVRRCYPCLDDGDGDEPFMFVPSFPSSNCSLASAMTDFGVPTMTSQ